MSLSHDDRAVLEQAMERRRAREPEHRRTLSPVRRYSRARGEAGRYVFLSWDQANERMRALDRWERRQTRQARHRNRGVGYIGLEVYRYLCRRAVDRRGKLDDLAYGTIAGVLGFARSAVVAAVVRLKRFGWLDWTRQYEATGEAGRRGPQVKQTTNFFWICAPVAALLKMGIRFGPPPPPDDAAHQAEAKAKATASAELAESPLGEALARAGDVLRQRETS